MEKPVTPIKQLASKVIWELFKIFQEEQKPIRLAEIKEKILERGILTEDDKENYKATNTPKWITFLQFWSIDCVKSGFLIKNKGIWEMTQEGEEAAKSSTDALEFLKKVTDGYKAWVKNNQSITPPVQPDGTPQAAQNGTTQPPADGTSLTDGDGDSFQKLQAVILSEAEQKAETGILEQIKRMGAYEFQDLVAALIRAMGYHTPFIAQRGKKDGGIDIKAYPDPLGLESPCIKVQVKHKGDTKASRPEIQQLVGTLRRQNDVGVFVSTAGFTLDAESEAKNSHTTLELIDGLKLINLWQDHYERMTQDDQKLLSLKRVYFLDLK